MTSSTAGAYAAPRPDHRAGRRTIAQWYCLLGGAALALAGAFGFLADASFDTTTTADTDAGGNADGTLQGDGFLGFEVNGWHNVVHIASGLLLLVAARRARPARVVALGFGLVYGVVALIGLIDGNDVLGVIPINGPDNVLHVGLSLLGIVAGLASRPRTHEHEHEHTRRRGVAASEV